MKIYPLRLKPGDDLKDALKRITADKNIRAGFVLSCSGSLNHVHLRLAGACESRRISGPLEIVSLTGSLSQDGPHLHISVADANGCVFGGHLLKDSRVHTTAEVILGESKKHLFSRVHDATTGFKELMITNRLI